MTREEFVRKARAAATKANARSGFPVDVAVAQAALESNFGESQLSKTANNYFGIKAHGKHPVMEFRTCEFGAKGEEIVVQRFAVFESMDECFACRDSLIESMAVYAGARAAKGDPEKFAHELGKHWATDPRYAEKVLKIAAEIGSQHSAVSIQPS